MVGAFSFILSYLKPFNNFLMMMVLTISLLESSILSLLLFFNKSVISLSIYLITTEESYFSQQLRVLFICL